MSAIDKLKANAPNNAYAITMNANFCTSDAQSQIDRITLNITSYQNQLCYIHLHNDI